MFNFNFQCITEAMYKFEAFCDLMAGIDQLIMKINSQNDLFPVHLSQGLSYLVALSSIILALVPGTAVSPGPGAGHGARR